MAAETEISKENATAIRQYVVVPAHPDLYSSYIEPDLGEAIKKVQEYLHLKLPNVTGMYEVVALCTRDWHLDVERVPQEPPAPTELVVSLLFHDEATTEEFRDAVQRELGGLLGADLAARETEYWCPVGIEEVLFGDRVAARELINADQLGMQNLFGNNVNVVIVDHGLDQRVVGANFRGGWSHTNPNTGAVQAPGMTRGDDARHGTMMVRNILDLAPNAGIWDLPLIPPRIWNIGLFVADAQAALNQVLDDIQFLSQWRQWSGPWVLVNAWAIFDRRSEFPPGDYTNRLTHPFNVAVTRAANEGRDVVFCAGNCGQFCPDQRCGPTDQGPGQSIFGANSHPRVVSVGAVRVDARWLGYSSQGPGQPNMVIPPNLPPLTKPDICAPSNFSETHDAYTGNTGTSAATGVTAGVVAALRSRWGPGAVSPDNLRVILSLTARKTEGPGWNGRLGYGILNVETALQALANILP
jgi:subtilisin family serine protease